MTILRPALIWLLALLSLAASGCSSWSQARRFDRWTMYVKPDDAIDLNPYYDALEPAFEAVEARLGSFEGHVRVHAWNGSVPLASNERDPVDATRGRGPEDSDDVPGIGPARVRAFHVRGSYSIFSPSGVFLGTSDVGTAVHELVHARLAEQDIEPPLWFEEGLASLWGDGVLFEGEWISDGLACWPARVLREENLTDAELEHLLSLSAQDDYSARENLLVHFVGWALAFDLSRDFPGANWRTWLVQFERAAERTSPLIEARRRLARALSTETQELWLERLSDPRPGVRLATAQATWKLHSPEAVGALLAALENETHPEVRFALAINALLGAGEVHIGPGRWRSLSRLVFPTLRDVYLPDPTERSALREFYTAMRSRADSTEDPLNLLSRYWEE